MKARSSIFLFVLSAILLAFTTAQATKNVNLVVFPVDKELYQTWDQTRSNRFQEFIFDEFAATLILGDRCSAKPNFKLFSYGPLEFRWVMWYGDEDTAPADDQFTQCNFVLDSEMGLIHTRIQQNDTVAATGFKLFRSPTITTESRPATCFNGKRDDGEVSTDCGRDACNIPCAQQKYCDSSEDCVVECFANMCQYYAASSSINTLYMLITLTVAVLVAHIAF